MGERGEFVLTDCSSGRGGDNRPLGLDESEMTVRNALTDRV